jgi:hypothetical protein
MHLDFHALNGINLQLQASENLWCSSLTVLRQFLFSLVPIPFQFSPRPLGAFAACSLDELATRACSGTFGLDLLVI